MTDLTKIETPFGLLDDETKDKLAARGGPYEIWAGDRWDVRAFVEDFDPWYTYRARPLPPEPREGWTVGTLFPSAREAKTAYPGKEPIHVREVL